MVDVVDKSTRSRMMSGIQSKNTKPELLVRRGLHGLGFRYSLHSKTLPGKPDLVFAKYKAIIQINGCFWHAHDCHLFTWPKTRKHFWETKLKSNQQRDKQNLEQYQKLGWRVLSIWECALKGNGRLPSSDVIVIAAKWLKSDSRKAEIRGRSKYSGHDT